MAYSEELAERIRRHLSGRKQIEEKKMFGGVGFLQRGNMCVGIWKESLIARIGPEVYEHALEQPAVSEFDITGRPMRGWVMIAPAGLSDEESLANWITLSLDFVRTLPAK